MHLLADRKACVVEQLALDDALLAAGEEIIRFWESRESVVVLGRSNREAEWIEMEACLRDRVPVLRRSSGGGAVIIGQGCLNYSVLFSLGTRPAWADVRRSFEEILRPMAAALEVKFCAPSDLACDGRKVAGCAQRRTATAVLHHGTLLYDFDVELAERYLKMPPREPGYRGGRSHREFLGNLARAPDVVRERVAEVLHGL